MNIFQTIFLVTICTFNGLSLIAQKQFVKGVILSQLDSSTVSHAHIINTVSKIGVTSNQNGEFFIPAKSEDTLIISFIVLLPTTILLGAPSVKKIIFIGI